jgi:hypothetical protein
MNKINELQKRIETLERDSNKDRWYQVVWGYTRYIYCSITKWVADGPGPTDNNV